MQPLDKKTRKRLAILDALEAAERPLSSATIADRLREDGHDISERTVRLYLGQLQAEGLCSAGRRGHLLTERGQAEHGATRIMDRLGFMAAKVDQISYRMSFDIEQRKGTVAVNTAFVRREVLLPRLPMMLQVFEKRYSMGDLLALLRPGEAVGDAVVPPGMVGLCTVCSVTLNGILLKHGVPTRSLFSGLLEMTGGQPTRFAELIAYDGTTLDPLELFIRGGMTNYMGAVTTGNGRIGAGFREVPAECHNLVVNLADHANRIGLGGFLRIGRPAQTLFNIPVRQGCCGAVVIGGLNPIAIMEESGERVKARALAGLMDFHRLFHYRELEERLRALPL